MKTASVTVALAALCLLAHAGLVRADKKAPTPRQTKTVEAVRVPLPPPSRPVAELEAELDSPDASRRAAAARELAGAGVVPESVANTLKAALYEDPDPAVRAEAVWALAHVAKGVAEPATTLQPVPYDQPPRLVEQARVAYPQAAFDEGVQGTVVLDVLIDEEGRIARAEVRQSIPALDAGAVASVKQWRFEPARMDGKPIATVAQMPVEFRISSRP